MMVPSITQANSKTAEFARLFDLFDRIATRRSRVLTGETSEVISADDITNVPAEFAPLLKNLSTILSSRTRRDQERNCYSTPTRSNTTGAPSDAMPITEPLAPPADAHPSDQIEEDTERPTFPLGPGRYPFTFKLMLHNLYDVEEWIEKVEDVVMTSQSQFKPLAERVQNVVGDKERVQRGSARPVLGASAKFKPPIAARQPRSTTVARDASKERGENLKRGIRPALGTSAKFKPPSTTRHPLRPVTAPLMKPEASRVLKKRCIGRRKSINGPISTGVWVYDAAVSATVTELVGPRPAVEITLSAPRGTGGRVGRRVRHRSVAALEEIRIRDTTRHKVKITVPLLREGSESVSSRSSLVLQEVAQVGNAKKRRSTASVFASEPWKRAAVKRPLCI